MDIRTHMVYTCKHIMMPKQHFKKLAQDKMVGGCGMLVHVICVWDTVADIGSNTDDNKAGW